MDKNSFGKVLTKNDAGETGSHQAGLLIPKSNLDLIDFFPELDKREFNPDAWINCIDHLGNIWRMRYIYYNGAIFNPPLSSRNEYRLTHMTKFISEYGLKSGDTIIFTSTKYSNEYHIRFLRSESLSSKSQTPETIKLKGWNTVY